LPEGIAFVGERFARYTVVFVVSAYSIFGIPDAANIKVRARDIIIRIERSAIPF
jgi:hypothetical protein